MLKDIKACYVALKQVKQARKAGHKADIGVKLAIPVINTSNWGWTMESCVLSNVSVELSRAVKAVFCNFDKETQKALTFTPAPGEWVERAKLWKRALEPVLPPAQYRMAILALLSWYIRCVTHQEAAV